MPKKYTVSEDLLLTLATPYAPTDPGTIAALRRLGLRDTDLILKFRFDADSFFTLLAYEPILDNATLLHLISDAPKHIIQKLVKSPSWNSSLNCKAIASLLSHYSITDEMEYCEIAKGLARTSTVPLEADAILTRDVIYRCQVSPHCGRYGVELIKEVLETCFECGMDPSGINVYGFINELCIPFVDVPLELVLGFAGFLSAHGCDTERQSDMVNFIDAAFFNALDQFMDITKRQRPLMAVAALPAKAIAKIVWSHRICHACPVDLGNALALNTYVLGQDEQRLVIKMVKHGWSPETHKLYPEAAQRFVKTVLLVCVYLQRPDAELPCMPRELWHSILSF